MFVPCSRRRVRMQERLDAARLAICDHLRRPDIRMFGSAYRCARLLSYFAHRLVLISNVAPALRTSSCNCPIVLCTCSLFAIRGTADIDLCCVDTRADTDKKERQVCVPWSWVPLWCRLTLFSVLTRAAVDTKAGCGSKEARSVVRKRDRSFPPTDTHPHRDWEGTVDGYICFWSAAASRRVRLVGQQLAGAAQYDDVTNVRTAGSQVTSTVIILVGVTA